jgi:hypothetical protein
MTRHEYNQVTEIVAESADRPEFDGTTDEITRRADRTPGLSAHVRQMRNRNQGVSRWLVLAIFAGAVVALAMVQFAVR